MLGVVSLLLLLVDSHFGFLLNGDLRSYWATQVLLGITRNQPLVGDVGAVLLQGGPELGNLTLTRFYTLHILVLPALLAAVATLHGALRRRAGATPPPGMSSAEAEARTEPFFPGQLTRAQPDEAGAKFP